MLRKATSSSTVMHLLAKNLLAKKSFHTEAAKLAPCTVDDYPDPRNKEIEALREENIKLQKQRKIDELKLCKARSVLAAVHRLFSEKINEPLLTRINTELEEQKKHRLIDHDALFQQLSGEYNILAARVRQNKKDEQEYRERMIKLEQTIEALKGTDTGSLAFLDRESTEDFIKKFKL